jgi:hypothetical protein
MTLLPAADFYFIVVDLCQRPRQGMALNCVNELQLLVHVWCAIRNGAVLPLSAAPVGRGADGADAMA